MVAKWKPQAGRLSPKQAAHFGRTMTHGFGYFGVGPVFVIFNLPPRWRRADPPPPARVPIRVLTPEEREERRAAT
jgi:hypothetical protein